MSKRIKFLLFLVVVVLLTLIISTLLRNAYPIMVWENFIKIIIVFSFIFFIGYPITFAFAKKTSKTVAKVLVAHMLDEIKKGLTTTEEHPRISQFELKSMELLVKKSLEKDLGKVLKEYLFMFYLLTIVILVATFILIRLMMKIPILTN